MILDLDYNEKVYIYQYFTLIDYISYIGGIIGFIVPVLYVLAPFSMLYYLYRLGQIIK